METSVVRVDASDPTPPVLLLRGLKLIAIEKEPDVVRVSPTTQLR